MAATITPGYAFGTTEQVTAAKLAALVSQATISGLDITSIASGTGLVVTSASAPSNTNALWIDSANANTLKYWNGSAWVAVSGAAVPPQYRGAMYVMQASTTTITVAPGVLEINSAAVAKTANTTLTISTAGDWAGGSSLRAANTTGYVGVDASGNIKMHTTAPTHADYGLTITAANNTKRYVTWSGTVYRIIGWFRMNATGSGELDTYGVSNIADGAVKNVVEFETGAVATGTTVMPNDDTIPQITEGDQFMSLGFVPTNVNNKLKITIIFMGTDAASPLITALFQDAIANAIAASINYFANAGDVQTVNYNHYMKAATVTFTTFRVRAGAASATCTFNGSGGARKLGGVLASSMKIEEIESELT